MRKRLAALVGVVVLIGALSPAAAVAAKPHTHKPAEVRTSRDAAKDKIHPKLRKLIDAGSTANVYVFATVAGDPKAASAMLGNVHVATTPNKEASLVIGRAKPGQLVKLAGLPSVISIRPIELTKSGSPLSDPDPDVGDAGPSNAALKGIFKQLKGKEVPYDKAPPLKTTNFEQLKQLALLDARTHRFAEAWQAGYTGEGSVVSVLDGGTDFGHPDMIGTWQTRPSTGWPNALDPFDSLVLAVQPGNVDLGLTWYTKTEAKSSFTQSVQDKKKGIVNVSFAVRRGPSRNFAAPDATATHTYSFPQGLDEVRHGPPRRSSRRPPAQPVRRAGRDPRDRSAHAGVYDTVYVDLDHDYSFADEKPVTKSSPASYRDMDGEASPTSPAASCTTSRTAPARPGPSSRAARQASASSVRDAPGALLAWPATSTRRSRATAR